LLAVCDLTGSHVLEVGCGDGKFTRQYAHLPRKVVGIDPVISDLQLAVQEPALSSSRVRFVQTMGENLPFPRHTFDITIFACSL
ncbi:MAG TPA: class I SAM-dependent methyltransferase, partial [Anaerolineales bacterium]